VLKWLQKKDVRNFKELGRLFEKYHERRGDFFTEVTEQMRKDQSAA
jgi:hypothetical protein